MAKNKKAEDETIERIIHEEGNEAFCIFPMNILNSRLKACLKNESERKKHSGLRFSRTVLVVAVSLLAVCVGVFILINVFSTSHQRITLSAIEQFLKESSVMHTMMENQAGSNLKSTAENTEEHILRSNFKEAFSSMLGRGSLRQKQIPLQWDENLPEDMDLEKKMKILIKDKTLIRFLSKYFKNVEEIKNGQKDLSFHHCYFIFCESHFC